MGRLAVTLAWSSISLGMEEEVMGHEEGLKGPVRRKREAERVDVLVLLNLPVECSLTKGERIFSSGTLQPLVCSRHSGEDSPLPPSSMLPARALRARPPPWSLSFRLSGASWVPPGSTSAGPVCASSQTSVGEGRQRSEWTSVVPLRIKSKCIYANHDP